VPTGWRSTVEASTRVDCLGSLGIFGQTCHGSDLLRISLGSSGAAVLIKWRGYLQGEFGRYLVAGGLAFLCDFSVLYVLTDVVGTHYLWSAFFGYMAGLVVSYSLNIKWVFVHRKYDSWLAELSIFNLIVVIGLLLNESLIYWLVEFQSVNYLYAKIVTTGVILFFNFFAKKWFLFRAPVVLPIPGIHND
jgi:putative flippase GtrA